MALPNLQQAKSARCDRHYHFNEQLAFAKNRIAMAGLQDKVNIKFCDYRDLNEKYDRIVSIEMFEAVGESYWPTYFEQVRNCLKPGGKAGLQIITIAKERFDAYRKKTDFIQRYIFPGGMLPSPERLDTEFANADLKLVAREDFATDYARTLAEWRHRFRMFGRKCKRLVLMRVSAICGNIIWLIARPASQHSQSMCRISP